MIATLQTKDGKIAQSLTSMESEYIMGNLWKLLHTRKFQRLLPLGTDYTLSFDGDGCPRGADAASVGIPAEAIEHHPSNSSDMHKVVENCHGSLQNHMQRWLLKREREQPDVKLQVEECKGKLQKYFSDMNNTGEIQRNVATLKDTYRDIIAKKGGYPSKRLRQ
jgi:hypothetical protein